MKKVFVLVLVVLMASCCTSKEQKNESQLSEKPGPHAIVYKTKADYSMNVPISLNEDGTIMSYPDPRDLMRGDEFTFPTQLENGYLLDNRGIGTNVAFLKWTYEEYAAMSRAPLSDSIIANILDKKPLKEMYDCGLLDKFDDPVAEINEVVLKGRRAMKKTYNKIY